MDEGVQAYLDVQKRCKAAVQTLGRLGSAVIEVATALQFYPENFGFSNVPGLQGLPIRVSTVADAREWPAAIDLQHALAQCHREFAELKAAWLNVTDNTGLMPPGEPWLELCALMNQAAGRE